MDDWTTACRPAIQWSTFSEVGNGRSSLGNETYNQSCPHEILHFSIGCCKETTRASLFIHGSFNHSNHCTFEFNFRIELACQRPVHDLTCDSPRNILLLHAHQHNDSRLAGWLGSRFHQERGVGRHALNLSLIMRRWLGNAFRRTWGWLLLYFKLLPAMIQVMSSPSPVTKFPASKQSINMALTVFNFLFRNRLTQCFTDNSPCKCW